MMIAISISQVIRDTILALEVLTPILGGIGTMVLAVLYYFQWGAQDQQTEIMKQQKKMLSQGYDPEANDAEIRVNGDEVIVSVTNEGAGLMVDSRLVLHSHFNTGGDFDNETRYETPLKRKGDKTALEAILQPGDCAEFFIEELKVRLPNNEGEVTIKEAISYANENDMSLWIIKIILYYESVDGTPHEEPLRVIDTPESAEDFVLEDVL
ncbi:hypothetical protein [Natronobacterium gregoryi]|uniref:Uncharacterized protein n=2 Tax=Natronobacterium gregoryi TaxID=44930 RepID=L0AGM6_NATGS|nr:hypothetical protein [Natronobacterium gregoryi]AFZ73053.1 hypothetical protein Natgr_1868 [Natronobacterium gregoryi SP2]ELY70842.1 hypothetical protein C490_06112 [Natronobacterium gregoryi SP2]PLK20423.1 hypothetical protein CYV19_09860 [Natronobacterium gregoryi SP2]SFI62506.1 hypothetical protein SAMN05443661_102213 [Natronobacterium gregoryi]